jgi:hypothetical protein
MDISHICASMVAAHLYVCIYKNKNRKKIKDHIFFLTRKDRILRGRKERMTVWFWLTSRSYKGKLKKVHCIWIKIHIWSWSCPYYYIFLIWIKIPIHPKLGRSNWIRIPII